MRTAGDRWWPATLLLFGPRWLIGVPILVLLPFMAFVRARYLWLLLATFLFLLVAVLGFRVPLWPFTPRGDGVRVLTYNVAGDHVSADALDSLLRRLRPDIVALQECRPERYAEVFQDWHTCHEGELLIATRSPVQQNQAMSSRHPPHKWPRATLLSGTINDHASGPIAIATVHLPSARYGLSAIMDRHIIINPARRALLDEETANRSSVSAAVAEKLASELDDRIVLGDFNMPVESWLYYRDWSRYRNAFSTKGFGFGFTVWAQLRRWWVAIRIDHVLTHGRWRVARCWVGPDMGSDHRPVVADLVRK